MNSQLRTERERADKFLELYQSAVQSDKEDRFAVRQLLDKTIGLLGTKDGLAYQQVQAMNPVNTGLVDSFDPSDNGEFLREIMRGEYDFSADGAATPEEVFSALSDLGIAVPDNLNNEATPVDNSN